MALCNITITFFKDPAISELMRLSLADANIKRKFAKLIEEADAIVFHRIGTSTISYHLSDSAQALLYEARGV